MFNFFTVINALCSSSVAMFICLLVEKSFSSRQPDIRTKDILRGMKINSRPMQYNTFFTDYVYL